MNESIVTDGHNTLPPALANLDPRLYETEKGQHIVNLLARVIEISDQNPQDITKHTTDTKNGHYVTEIFGPVVGFGNDDRWSSESLWVRYSSDQEGNLHGSEISLSTRLNNTDTGRFINKSMPSVDNGKLVYDENVRVGMLSFERDGKLEVQIGAEHMRGGNFYGDHFAYDNDPEAKKVIDEYVQTYTHPVAV